MAAMKALFEKIEMLLMQGRRSMAVEQLSRLGWSRWEAQDQVRAMERGRMEQKERNKRKDRPAAQR